MALKLEDKKKFVKEINAVAGESISVVAAAYRGLSVAEMTELRRDARNAGVYLRVVKIRWHAAPSKEPNLSVLKTRSMVQFCSRLERKIRVPLPGLSGISLKSTKCFRRFRCLPVGNYCRPKILRDWLHCRRSIRPAQFCWA